ncbi:hypothetical protein [Acinetobacter sp. TSRC1-2]|uniref:hypothetical protein n=1 Tax=unclassified Acinetobacter TaxID=196816 RepID=UPI003CFB8C21
MSRKALTSTDHIYAILDFARIYPAFEKSHFTVLKLIDQKDLKDLTHKEILLLKKTYQYIQKRIKINEVLVTIYRKDPNKITTIEKDILDYSYIEEVIPPVIEHYRVAEKMLENYMSNLPPDMKINIHQNILAADNDLEKKQKVKDKKMKDHKKFFIGATFLSFFNLYGIDDDPLETLFEMVKLHLMHDYFGKDLLSDAEINEFNISEIGREFNNKKNSILINPNNPFQIYNE